MYTGRFAPSPTGELHLGSLFAAVISFLEAKTHNGKWLVRIEDIDPPREQEGASTAILQCLDAHGLHWDGEVMFQSKRYSRYQEIIETLIKKKAIFPCQCSRKQLSAFNGAHPSQCIQPLNQQQPFALRAPSFSFEFNDLYQGKQTGDDGHFIVKRREGLFAYQLAVIVDDHDQSISHVIRGYDLLDSTPKQLYLYQALDWQPPLFGHFPILVNEDGSKLSKQNLAPAINHENAIQNLNKVMALLGLPQHQDAKSPEQLLEYAVKHWQSSQTSNVIHKTTLQSA
jgi:glutamyl-Q tRNA(Asp) synthetase